MIFKNAFYVFVVIYLTFGILFNQSYKIVVKNMKNAAAVTVLLEGLAGMFALLFIPFFEFSFPTNPFTYLFLFLAIIFYTVNDRLSTTVRSGLDGSTYLIIKQLSVVFMILNGFLLFKEKIIFKKVLGSLIILFSNFLIFYERRKFRFNKYIFLGIIANLFMSIALLIDVSYSNEFNLPFYVFLILIVPALLILIFEKVTIKKIKNEYINGNKKVIVLTSFSWAIMTIAKLRIYQLGEVVESAVFCSLTVILTVIVEYFFFNQKNKLLKKVVASIMILLGILIIKI